MNYERSEGRSPEVTSHYEGIGHTELIGTFYESEGNPEIGRELSVRIFEHAGLEIDPRIAPLIGRDGAQVWDGDTPLTLADYINFAAKHHFGALGSILDFLAMEPGDEDYHAAKAMIIARLNITRS